MTQKALSRMGPDFSARERKVVEALSFVNPCGLPGKTYTNLESLVKGSDQLGFETTPLLDKDSLFWRFHNSFLEEVHFIISHNETFF